MRPYRRSHGESVIFAQFWRVLRCIGLEKNGQMHIAPPGESVDVDFTSPASQSPHLQKITVVHLADGDAVNEVLALELAYSDWLGSILTLAWFPARREESTN